MKKSVPQNFIRVIIAFMIVFSGNFIFAAAHYSCKSDGKIHHDCENDCCKTDNCCSDDFSLKFISIENDCCEIHSEKIDLLESGLPLSDNSVKKVSAAIYSDHPDFSKIFLNKQSSKLNSKLLLRFVHKEITLRI